MNTNAEITIVVISNNLIIKINKVAATIDKAPKINKAAIAKVVSTKIVSLAIDIDLKFNIV